MVRSIKYQAPVDSRDFKSTAHCVYQGLVALLVVTVICWQGLQCTQARWRGKNMIIVCNNMMQGCHQWLNYRALEVSLQYKGFDDCFKILSKNFVPRENQKVHTVKLISY